MEENKFDNITQEEANVERDILLENEIKYSNEKIEKNKANKFVTELGRSVTDTIVMGAISALLYFIVEGVLQVSGYKIINIYKVAFLFVIYLIISLLYRSVFSLTKSEKTVGEMIFK